MRIMNYNLFFNLLCWKIKIKPINRWEIITSPEVLFQLNLGLIILVVLIIVWIKVIKQKKRIDLLEEELDKKDECSQDDTNSEDEDVIK